MDIEQFDGLPDKDQEKLLKHALKNTFLELQTIPRGGDYNGTRMIVRLVYQYPRGDEWRYYTDAHVDIKSVGNHAYSGLEFSTVVTQTGGRGWSFHYDDIYSRVTLHRAKRMYQTLNWLDKRIKKETEELFEDGYADTFGDFILAVAFAIGVVGGVRVSDNRERTKWNSLSVFLDMVAETEQDLIKMHTEYAERKQEEQEEAEVA